ncbi:MAG: hypothetical protein ACK2U9_22275, partial [Anaerolineae bacterium]
MTPTIQLVTLGSLEMRLAEAEFPPASLPLPATAKSQSLLVYLAVHRRKPHLRDHLADLFWGERPEQKARRSLSTALWHIRRCLPDDAILADQSTVQFNGANPLWLDSEAFQAAAAGSDLADMEAAAALRRGDFLDGFYDDWV